MYNPLDHPICFAIPSRLEPSSAWTEHIPFAMLLVELLQPSIIVELGTYTGVSYCAFCQAAKELHLDTSCYAIDTWQGDLHGGQYGPEVLSSLRKHHDVHYGGFSRLIQSTFQEALPHFIDGTIDLLHIDGYHTYEAVKQDFESWLPKLSPSAVVLFHDTNVREADFGVWQFWNEIKCQHPHFEFFHGHGLGVLAAGKIISKEFDQLLKAKGEDASRLRDFFFQLGNRLTAKIELEMKVSSVSYNGSQLIEQQREIEGATLEAARRDELVQSLSTGVAEKEHAIQVLSAQVAEKENAVQAFSVQVAEMVQSLLAQINEKEQAAQTLSLNMAEKEKVVQALSAKINEQQREIEGGTLEAARRDGLVQSLLAQINEKEQAAQTLLLNMAEKEKVVQALSAKINEQQREVEGATLEAARRDELVQSLSTGVAEKEHAIQVLSAQVAEKENAVQAFSVQVAEMVQSLLAQINEKEQAAQTLSLNMAEKEKVVQALSAKINEQQQIIQRLSADSVAIANSTGWTFLLLLWRIRRVILPHGNSRGKILRSKNSLLSHLSEFSILKKLLSLGTSKRDKEPFFQRADPESGLNDKALIQPPLGDVLLSLPHINSQYFDENMPLIARSVSIVIPTKNAGSDFNALLRKLKSQKGVKLQEIIIVDSGSTDNTLEIAKAEGVKLVEIPSESFTHSYSRNKGAEVALGGYLLFMVQDAMPLTDRWIWEMAKALENNNVAAISCAEYPRSDADLFYRLLAWNHYKTMNLNKDRLLFWNETCLNHMGLRSNAQINNVGSLIKKEVFLKYKFKRNYAEDLDLGIRLIKDNYKLGFLYTTRVLHSHNRPPYYFFKRAYVDNKFLSELFTDFEYPIMEDQYRLFSDIVSLYGAINNISYALADLELPVSIEHLFSRIRELLSPSTDNYIISQQKDIIDENFNSTVHSFIKTIKSERVCLLADNLILPHLLHSINMLENYVSNIYQVIDRNLLNEITTCLYKLFTLQSGGHLAFLFLVLSAKGKADSFLSGLDRQLTEGV